MFGKWFDKVKPSKAIAGIVDAVVARLIGSYDIRFEVTIVDNKIVVNPVVLLKAQKVDVDEEAK